jgi:hypothetical protein
MGSPNNALKVKPAKDGFRIESCRASKFQQTNFIQCVYLAIHLSFSVRIYKLIG